MEELVGPATECTRVKPELRRLCGRDRFRAQEGLRWTTPVRFEMLPEALIG